MNNIPYWVKAGTILQYLVQEIDKESEESIKDAFNVMLDKNGWFMTVGLGNPEKTFNDVINFGFRFIQDDKPEFSLDITTEYIKGDGVGDDNRPYNLILGIPYPALFAMNANKSKKDAIQAYIHIIRAVIVWHVCILLQMKYEKADKIEIKTRKEIQMRAYSSEILCLLTEFEIKAYYDFVKCLETDKEKVLEFIKDLYEDNYAYDGMIRFIKDLSTRDYKKFIVYIKDQESYMKLLQKAN